MKSVTPPGAILTARLRQGTTLLELNDLIPGTEIRKCYFCRHDVVCAPSSAELIKQDTVQVCICFECVLEHKILDGPEAKVMGFNEQQIAEIKKILKHL